MGKPYQKELEQLCTTYSWALESDVDELVASIARSVDDSLIAIGSGGSYSAACFAAALHSHHCRRVASPATPLETQRLRPPGGNVTHLVISAGGNNRDITNAYQSLIGNDVQRIILLIGRRDTKLARLATAYPWVDVHEFPIPTGSDGFLATNSLLAFCTLQIRAYMKLFDTRRKLPNSLAKLPAIRRFAASGFRSLDRLVAPLWERKSLVLLHSSTLLPAAVDVESRFSEAALGDIQIADFRQFGHGRHNWIAKRTADTAVVSLVDDDDQALASRTLALLPDVVPTVILRVPGPREMAMLGGMLLSIYLAGSAGAARNIDPGRPGVPPFGRRLYHLSSPAMPKRITNDVLAINRKIQSGEGLIVTVRQLTSWKKYYSQFCHRLSEARFRGIVLDYDGTLCDRRDRFHGVAEYVRGHLQNLIRRGMAVGIATGRGKSVRDAMRALIPKEYWEKITVGYYNGSQIATLADDSLPRREPCCNQLQAIFRSITKDNRLKELAEKIETRGAQISIQARVTAPPLIFRALVKNVVESTGNNDVKVVWSTHSIDVLGNGVSKCAVISKLRTREIRDDDAILTVGDLGKWPGNDHELLSQPYSLSVDEVSADPMTCWNLAPAGCRGVQATISYFCAFSLKRDFFVIDPSRIRRPRM